MSKFYMLIIGMVFFVFLIGGNLAWLNPRPGFNPSYRISEKIPFMWQYNRDSRAVISLGAYFPDPYRIPNAWGQRPVYPLLSHAIGFGVYEISSLFYKWEFKEDHNLGQAAIGYIILKLIVFSIFGIACFRLLRNYIDDYSALLAVLLFLFSELSIVAIATYHMTEMQVIAPLIIVSMFLDLSKSYSLSKNMIYSCVVGIMMLIKPNYAAYLAVILFCLWQKKFWKISVSLFFHALPWICWFGFLKYQGWGFRSSEMDHEMVIWIYQELFSTSFLAIITKVEYFINEFFISIAKMYPIWIYLAVFTVPILIEKTLQKKEIIFISLFVFSTWVQVFASRYTKSTMVADLSFIVYGLAAFAMMRLLRRWISNDKLSVALVSGLWLVWSVLSLVHLPWVHPYDQVVH